MIFIVSKIAFIPNGISLKEDDFFIYKITNGGYYLEIGKNKKIVDGFKFGPYTYPSETKVNSTIGSIESHGVTVINWIGNFSSYVFLSIGWFDSFAIYYSYYTLYHTYEMIENFGNGYVIDLTLFNIKPFTNPKYNGYLASPETLGGDISNFFDEWSYWYPDIECSYNHSEKNSVVFFESWVGGEVHSLFGEMINGGTNYRTDIAFGNNFHFTINKETGIVYGFGRQGWVEGTINNNTVKICMTCEYELEGYDLPDYAFGEYHNFLANNNLALFIAIPSSVVLLSASILLGFYLRKKKISKKPDN